MSSLANIGVYHAPQDTRVPIDIDIKDFDKDKNTYGVMIDTEIGSTMIEFITHT